MTLLYLALAIVLLGPVLIGPAVVLVIAMIWIPLLAATFILAVPLWLIGATLRRLGLQVPA